MASTPPWLEPSSTTGPPRWSAAQSTASVALATRPGPDRGAAARHGWYGEWNYTVTLAAAARPAHHRAGWLCWLLALEQSHVGGLGALRPWRHVELDGLALIK